MPLCELTPTSFSDKEVQVELKEYLEKKMGKYDAIVTLEENVKSGGFGEHVSAFLAQAGYQGKMECISVPDEFIQHGDAELLKHKLLNAEFELEFQV